MSAYFVNFRLAFLIMFSIAYALPSYAQYCFSSSISAFYCSTSLVSIGTLNNASSGCANYSDYTTFYTELLLNGTYTLEIGLENCSGFTMPKVSNVYIDWNGNEIFDLGEEVFHIDATSAIDANQTNFSTSLTVPANAVQDTIRMRIVTVWSTSDDGDDYSCGMYGWGETEDYSLIIRGLIQNVISNDNLCYGEDNGSINIVTSGLGSSLAYSIDGGSTFTSSPNFNTLSNGLYNVCVFDSTTNQIQYYSGNPVIIDSPDSLFANTTSKDVNCFNGSDGELTAEAFNGVANYNYTWTNGSTSISNAIASNLTSDYYTLTVEDGNGCLFIVDSLFVGSPAELIIDSIAVSSYSGYSVSCINSNDGYAEVFASGGTGLYSYSLNGVVSSNSQLQSLTAGIQSIILYDENLCQKDTFLTLNEPTGLSINNTILHLGCENENDGSINTIVSGGVGPYSIEVFNVDTNLSAINSFGEELFENLEVGNYTLSIIDYNNCMYEDTFRIENPRLSLSTEDISCYGNDDGQINYSIDFSTDIYTLISPSFTNNLSPGSYDFYIENNQGCFFDTTIIIYEPELIELEESVEIICKESDLAAIIINSSGGILPHTILWANGDTVFNPSYGIGTYSYTFSDNNNCITESDIVVLPPSIPQIDYSIEEPSCLENFDGRIDASVTLGYPPYVYVWDNNESTESFIDSLPPNRYQLVVIDSANCSSALLEVSIPYVYNECFFFPDAFTPNDDGINDTYEISSLFMREPISLSIYDRQGNKVFQSDQELVWDGTYKNQKCPIGKYYYYLQYANQYTTGEILLLE